MSKKSKAEKPVPHPREDLKRIREMRGIVQEELARQADVSVMTISRMERGFSIRPREAAKIAKVLGVTIGYIFDRSERPSAKPLIDWQTFRGQVAKALGEDFLSPEVEARLRFAYDEYVKQLTSRGA